MADTTADQVAAFLDDVGKRWDVWGEAESLPRLVKALEAVLNLADGLETNACNCGGSDCAPKRAQALGDAVRVREAISRELLAKEDTDAR